MVTKKILSGFLNTPLPTTPQNSPQLVSVPLAGKADRPIVKNKSLKCRMTYFGRTSCTFVKCQTDRKDVIKP